MRRNLLFLAVSVWFIAIRLNAQDTSADDLQTPSYELKQKRFIFAVEPLQWFNWAWRFDFEMRIGNGPGWLQFGPAVYYRNDNNSNYRYDHYYDYWSYYIDYDMNGGLLREPFSNLRGAGLDVNYKRFINRSRTFYIAAGLSYTRLKIEYMGMKWDSYMEDGLQYYRYMPGNQTQNINRKGINTYIGHQIDSRKGLHIDLFWGFGFRTSDSEKGKPSFSDYMFSYGYSGVVFLTGVRIGFGIK